MLQRLPPPWDAERDTRLTCVQVREETHDVRTFVFDAAGPRSFRYLPGQFMTFELPGAGEGVHRCYTLSSTPTRPDRISITVKRVPGGAASNWLHEHLVPGVALEVLGPAGEFSCFAGARRAPMLFLSGGSGITPLMSMTRALHDLADDADVVFVHCARTPADVVFAEELALLARHMHRLRLAVICEQQPRGSAYAGHLGRIDRARLEQIVPDFAEREVYTCGPAPFMAAVRGALQGAGFDMAHYHEESFAFETLTAGRETGTAFAAAPAELAAGTAGAGAGAVARHTVRLARSDRSFTCSGEERVLAAAAAAGVRIPSSCAAGICGTCKTRKISGEVEMKHGGGIRQREIDAGWILPCCSRPLTDLVLDR